MDAKLRYYFSKQLRRLFYRSPVRREAIKNAPQACVECHATGVDLELDHLEPVVPTDRPVTSLEYFMRMFCYNSYGEVDLNNLVLLCEPCHRAKSRREMGERAANKQGPYSAETKAKRYAKKKAKKARKRKSRR